MIFAIQINGYKGDGSKLETEYKFGAVEIKGDKGFLRIDKAYRQYDFDNKKEFNVNHFEIGDCVMSLKATAIDGYGKIDICFGDSTSAIWSLAEEYQEIQRLETIYLDTPKYYKKSYGDIKDKVQTARDEIKKRKKNG
jgi:hypothetical protein